MEKELITYAPEFPTSDDSMAVSFVKMVKLNMIEAQKSFFEIGFRLYEAQQNEYYKDLGFESLADCAEHHFGFKKTMVYDLINVYDSFNENHTKFINPKYKDFSQSQLIEMSKVKTFQVQFISKCKPTDTVKKIREARKIFTKHGLELYDCKSLDSLISAYEEKQKKDKADIVIEEAIINGEPVLDEENEIEEEPIQVEYESKGIEFKADAPKEEKTEITEDLCMPAYLQKDIFNSFCKNISLLLQTKYSTTVLLVGKNYTDFVKDLYRLISKFLFIRRSDIKMVLEEVYKNYDYDIKLNGLKQPLKVFIGNIVNSFTDFFEPPKESKK